MVSTVDVLSEQPWGETYYEWHRGWNIGWRSDRNHYFDFMAQFKLVPDRKQNYWKRGDIVLFDTSYFNWSFDHNCPWKKWFMTKEGYLDALKNDERTSRNNKVPLYAQLEYGILLSRYKWIKDKEYKVFYDYGSIIMMLTGPKAGRIRRYYIKTPYGSVSSYPYDHIVPFYKQREGIDEIPELPRIHEAINYSNGDRNQFILNMIASFHDENYPNNLEEKNDTPANLCVV